MRKKLLSLLALTFGLASSTWAEDVTISTPAQLTAFATRVNNGETGLNAKLTGPIDLSEVLSETVKWTPIGNSSNKYTGTFDGGGFTISGFSLTTTGKFSGFFGWADGATIKDFTIEGSINSTHEQVGGVVGRADKATISNVHSKVNITCTAYRQGGILGAQQSTGTVNIDRCTYSGTFDAQTTSGGNRGGFVGVTYNGSGAYVNITNCLFKGEVKDVTGDFGGFVGYSRGCNLTIKNCLSFGTYTNTTTPGQFIGTLNTTSRQKYEGVNYYITGNTKGAGSATEAGTLPVEVTVAQLESGEICYKLNGSTNGGTNWYQTIGTDNNPIPFSTSQRVYKKSESAYASFDVIDDKIQIGSATDLIDFAGVINTGDYTLNATLTADIPLTDWPTSIGNWSGKVACYKGHFNGGGFTIGSADFSYSTTGNYHGIFGVLSSGAIVENFTVRGTINSSHDAIGVIGFTRDTSVSIRNIHSYINITNSGTDKKAGGIVGNGNNGTTNIDRCTFSGFIRTSAKCHCGGIVGYVNNDNRAIINITNCLFDGEVTGTTGANDGSGAGGIIGYVGANPNSVVIRNCLSKGTVSGDISGQFYGAVKNAANSIMKSYYQGSAINGTADDTVTPVTLEATPVTDGQLASGEICYALNGDQSDIAFYQTIGSDANPTLDSTRERVYVSGYVCPNGIPQGDVTYSNTDETTERPHNYVNGSCSYCGELITDSNNNFLIGEETHLIWFANYVNSGHPSSNAKLTDDITLTDTWTTPIGNSTSAYTGTFDGQGNAIANFNYTSTGTGGLFGIISGATVKDFSIDGTLTVTSGTYTGVIGSSLASTVSGIHSTLTINVTGSPIGHVGGVIGTTEQGNGNYISCCSYAGTMTIADGNHNCFGGVVGYLGVDNVLNCANYGTISYAKSNCYAGGIVGYLNTESATIQNCLNTGSISYTGSDSPNTGGGAIIGYFRKTKADNVKNNYWLETSATGGSGTNTLGTIYSRTAEELASGEVAYKLGAAWYQTLGTGGDTYPTLDSSSEQVRYVGDAGYTTFYDPAKDWDLLGNAKAYIGTINGSALHLDEIEDIPANTAVIIGGTYYNKVSTTATANTTGNVLEGSTGYVVPADKNIYALAQKGNPAVVGFYPVSTGITIPAGKAYLDMTGLLVKEFFAFEFDDEATGISLMEDGRSKMEDGTIYNLAGQRLGKMQKGINIVNGKKILF